jgi:hypothetical protein
MNMGKRVSRGGVALLALAAGLATPGAAAQQTQPQAPEQGAPIGPPQLRDFDLAPRNRPTAQPRPTPTLPTPPAAQPQPTNRTAERAAPSQSAPRVAPTRETDPSVRAPVREDAPPPAQPAAPTAQIPANTAPVTTPAPNDDAPAPRPAPAADTPAPTNRLGDSDGVPLWLILLGGLGLGVVAYVALSRRKAATRRREALPEPEAIPAAAVTPTAPRVPRPDPVPRPWLEIELTPERTTADPEESIVEFEMTIRNNGGSVAKNVRLQAKLVCSTPEQDKEIAAFHRMKPGEHRTLEIPDIPAGQELKLKGRVDVKREDIKALRMDQRLIWVPLVAVNAFYEWGGARTGQTSKSFLVGREQPEAKDKMAPFRLDLGPRVYRTVGQRPYKIERRV